jgi:hypothetical protein
MKRLFKSKKGIALLATLVVAAAGAVAGYAYFTSTGTGSGSASVGAASTWTVSADTLKGTLYPDPSTGGTNLATVNYSVTNPGHGNQKLNQVVISIPSTWTVAGTQGGCNASDFSLNGAAHSYATGNTVTDPYGNDLTAGASTGGAVTVEMIDNGSTQNDCQNATVPLSFSAS